MKLKIFFCQFPNPWALRVSGMGGYTSKCEKSQNHCTLMSREGYKNLLLRTEPVPSAERVKRTYYSELNLTWAERVKELTPRNWSWQEQRGLKELTPQNWTWHEQRGLKELTPQNWIWHEQRGLKELTPQNWTWHEQRGLKELLGFFPERKFH
jgi:hypothetical protein